jgi:hypothetical protein
MTKLDPAQMHGILSPSLPEGEAITHAAYGVRQPNMWLMLPAFALAIIPGVILTQILTKHYIIGTSATALVVAQVSPKWRTLSVAVDAVKSRRAIPLSDLHGQTAAVKMGAIFTKIAFGQGVDGFKAKFHRAFSKENRHEAKAIGEAILAATGAE